MSTQLHPDESDCLAIPAEEAAKLLGISKRHFASLNSQGRVPRPINLGRSVRWSVEELRAWLAAGAPERSRWELLKRGDR
jgi:excisionase family DNA binding protein